MKEKFAGVNETLIELISGIILYGIVCQIVILIFWIDEWTYSTGLWIGVVTAIITAINMCSGIEKALDFDEATASKKMQAQSIIRYVAILIILTLSAVTGIANPLTAFIGIMGLKVAAYLQPFTHKLFIRLFGKKAES